MNSGGHNSCSYSIGRLAHQKRLRILLRALAIAWAPYIAAWEYCQTRWRSLKTQIVNNDNRAPEAVIAPWQNLTYFLAALAGCCVVDGSAAISMTSLDLPSHLSFLSRPHPNPIELAERFLSDLVDMLEVEPAQARETAREALGSELHPKLFGSLLSKLDQCVAHITELLQLILA